MANGTDTRQAPRTHAGEPASEPGLAHRAARVLRDGFSSRGSGQAMSRPGEIAPLTGLRGAASLCVILYHYTFEGGLGPNVVRRILGHGYLSVDVFFVLSGFVMALVHADEFRQGALLPTYLRFIAKRIARIYPLYIVMTVLCAIVAWFGYNDLWRQSGHISVWVIRNVLLVQSLGGGLSIDLPAWSISTEMAAYVLFPALSFICLWRGFRVAALAGAACVLALAWLSLIGPAWLPPGTRSARMAWLDLSDGRTLYPVVRCLAGFTLGVLTWRAFIGAPGRWLRNRPWPADVVAAAIVLALCCRGVDTLTVSLFPPLILCLAVDRSMTARVLSLRLFTFFGTISYALYLVHMPVRDVMESLLAAWTGTRLVLILPEFCVTLGLALVSYRLIERPGRQLARRLIARAFAVGGLPSVS